MRSQEEREREAEQNRLRLLRAEATALGLLLSRRNQAVEAGLRRGDSIAQIANRLEAGVADGISRGRILSRHAGIDRLREELAGMGERLGGTARVVRSEVSRDIRRAKLIAANYAARWVRKAEGETVAKAARAANAATLGSVQRIGVTESSEAFNTGRAKALRSPAVPAALLRVWDATLDKRTCPICAAADGTIVGVKEPFPQGEPGTIHPHDRCTWQVLDFAESGGQGLILPREPEQLFTFPAPAAPGAPAPLPAAQRAFKIPQPGYLAEQGGRVQRAIAYERMLASRVIPQAVKQFRGGATLKKLFAGIDESALEFSRTGYRAPLNPYEGVTGQKAINDIATGRALSPGFSRPLPPITITKYPRSGGQGGELSLTDGRHRLEAAQKAGATEIRARIRFYDKDLNVTWEGHRVIPVPKADPKNLRGRTP